MGTSSLGGCGFLPHRCHANGLTASLYRFLLSPKRTDHGPDRQDRTIGGVILPDGCNLNHELVKGNPLLLVSKVCTVRQPARAGRGGGEVSEAGAVGCSESCAAVGVERCEEAVPVGHERAMYSREYIRYRIFGGRWCAEASDRPRQPAQRVRGPAPRAGMGEQTRLLETVLRAFPLRRWMPRARYASPIESKERGRSS